MCFKNEEEKGPCPFFESSKTPLQEAIDDIEKLRSAPYETSDDAKNVYAEVSNIFKKYYSRKKQQNLMPYTTGDILLKMKSDEVSPSNLSETASILRVSDAVKFAKYFPSKTDTLKNLDSLKEVIYATDKTETKK